MTRSCVVCSTPVGDRDRNCPTCGVVLPRVPAPTPPSARRAVILEDPSPTGAVTSGSTYGGLLSAAPPLTSGAPSRPPHPAPSPSAARPAAGPRPARLVVEGTVTGAVTSDERAASPLDRRTLLPGVGLLLATTIVVLLIRGGLPVQLRVSGALMALVIALGVVAMTVRGADDERHAAVEVRRFRVRATSGESVDCELVGAQVGVTLREGDVVEVYGRRTRRGTARVREVVHPTSGSRASARRTIPSAVARVTTTAAPVVGVACVVLVVALLTGWV